jgi:hypothetical protein
MALWLFKSYLDENGADVIANWYATELNVKEQARFDKLLEHFRDNEQTEWGGNYFKPLSGYDGIFEIRFEVQNILWRPLGFFGPNRSEFTILVGAREKGDAFIPKSAPNTALKRRDIVLKDNSRSYECSF